MAKKPNALGVYLFAGGYALGVEKYFNVLAHLEEGPYGAATVKRNRPRRDIHDDADTWPLEDLAKTGVDFVFGNPPCAPWSTAAHSKKRTEEAREAGVKRWRLDKRVACVFKHFNVLKVVRPRVWAWESVPRAYTAGRPLVDELTAEALAMGYSVSYWLQNALDMGVPQSRQRFMMIAHDIELDFTPPLEPITTVRDAWSVLTDATRGEVETLDYRHLELLRHVKPGEALRAVFDRMYPDAGAKRNKQGIVGRPQFMAVRAHIDAPMGTMIGGNHTYHPEEDRQLTIKEMQLLCGYPVDYEFVPSREKAHDEYAQVAQAVMPPVGAWLARDVARAVKRDERIRVPYVREVDVRQPFNRKEMLRCLDDGRPYERPPRKESPRITMLPWPVVKKEDEAQLDLAAKAAADPVATTPPRKRTKKPPVKGRAKYGPRGDVRTSPTAVARVLIAQGATDDEILHATMEAFGPQSERPVKFTRHDLGRLRVRVAKEA